MKYFRELNFVLFSILILQMSYPLHFFDEMVGETISPIYSIYPPGRIRVQDLSEEIEKEGRQVVRALRSEFYNAKENAERFSYFEKIVKRLIKLKADLEDLIKGAQTTYITLGRLSGKIFPELENRYLLYNNIQSFIGVILLEFGYRFEGVDTEEAVKYNIHFHDRQDLKEHFREMAAFVSEHGHYDPDIMEVYGIEENEEIVPLCEHAFLKEEIDELREINSVLDPSSDSDISNFIDKFTREFVNKREMNKLNLFHGYALEFLLNELKAQKEEHDRVNLVMEFFLHTSLATELFMEFFQKQLDIIFISHEHENIKNEFNTLENRLTFIKENPQYHYFHAARIMEVKITTLDMAFELLRKNKKSLGMDTDEIETLSQSVESSESSNAEPKQIRLLEADGKKHLSEKIEYNGTADSLGLLFALFFESGLIKSKNQKARVARILSVSFNANGDSFGYDTILKAFKDPLSNQKSVKYVEEKLREIKVQLAQLKTK